MTTRFSLQLSDDVLDAARAVAEETHVSVDELLAEMVAEGIERRRGLKAIRDRAVRGNIGAALAILDRVPALEPDWTDRLL